MNDNAKQCFKEAVDKLKYVVSISVQVGDYDSAERILTQLRNLESLTSDKDPVKAPNLNEVTALELLREIVSNAVEFTPTKDFPNGHIRVTDQDFDESWIPKVRMLLNIP